MKPPGNRTFQPVIFSIFLALFLFSTFGCTETETPVKEPAVAGSFYPSDSGKLSAMVDGFLSHVQDSPVNGRLIALIAPHAGYMYSGAVAGHSYSHLLKKNIKTVILIGPSHHVSFKGASVYGKGRMKTPLGLVTINADMAGSLIRKEADVTFYPEAFEKEHSLEVQLPFLQRLFRGKVSIVPILIGSPTAASYNFLTSRLTGIMRENRDVIIIASTDLSHYYPYNIAVEKDSKTIDAIERMSPEDVQRLLSSREGEMCGGASVLITMTVARNLGATNGILYNYANSGDVTGDRSRVVGYGAIGLYQSPLMQSEKSLLLQFARDTIFSYVKEKRRPRITIEDKRLKANGAAFVTIKTHDGRLRGCMGNIMPTMPLYESVIANAVSAASRDPRFQPMREEELDDIDVEVTVLSPLEPMKDRRDFEVGRHGLYIVKGQNRGILLPQVPVEFGWDSDTFLKQVCLKAGLPEDAWKEASLYRFTAEIFE
jgi:AmmeMemoRadiSam system protein B/AmmeMemoRadiSam system protein A